MLNFSRRKPFDWIPDQGWQDVIELANVSSDVFSTLPDDIERNEKVWKEWFDHDSPESVAFPGKYEEKLKDFDRLTLLR